MGVTPIRIALSKAQSAELDAWAGRASYMRSRGTDKEFREHILGEASTVERYCKNCEHFKLYDGSCGLSTGEKDNNYTCKDFEECR